MLELAEAQKRILEAISPLPTESISLSDSYHRILGENLVSPIDLPTFDNSAVDGYAVRSKDLGGDTRPVALRLIGRIPAGATFSKTLADGECVRIFTGSPLPPGADSVAMQEDTQVAADDPNQILFSDSVKAWENVRFRGEDVKAGFPIAAAGSRLGPGHLSLIGAVGIEKIRVGRRPVVGVLSTGSELREVGEPLSPGEIYESNRIAVASLIERVGGIPRIFPLAPDTLTGTTNALREAFASCDAVVTTGGVSVGELDFVKSAFQDLGGELDFWKISMKPGKPFVFGTLQEKFLFGLPGNPVSALVTFILLAAPALARMQGASDFAWPKQFGVLSETLENTGDRRHFIRVSIDAAGTVHSAGVQASHILSALAKANGLVELEPKSVLAQGTMIPVLRFD